MFALWRTIILFGKIHGLNTDDVCALQHIKITPHQKRKECSLSLLLKSFLASESPLIKLHSRCSFCINNSMPQDYRLILAKKKG